MHLLVNGCSNTWGLELTSESPPKNESSEDKQYREENAWSGRLAKKLKVNKHTNISMPGSCNHRIVRTTIEYIVSLSDNEYNNLLVLIGWSCLYRIELYMQEFKKWHNFLPRFNSNLKKAYYYREKFAQRYMMEDYPCHEQFYIHTISLQSFFKANNINYLFFPIFPINWQLSSDFDNLINHIDDNRFVLFNEQKYSFYSILLDAETKIGYAKKKLRKPMGHPSEEGHEIWATRLERELYKRELI